MNSQVFIETIDHFTDARGLVVEPLPEALIARQHNIHVVLTEFQGIRGNHYHEKGIEIFIVIGPALVRLRESGKVWDKLVAEREVLRFTIPPKVTHAIQNLGTRPMLLICFNNTPHDRNLPDTYRDELIKG